MLLLTLIQKTRLLWASLRQGVLILVPRWVSYPQHMGMRPEPAQQLWLATFGSALNPPWLTWANPFDSFLVGAVSMSQPRRHRLENRPVWLCTQAMTPSFSLRVLLDLLRRPLSNVMRYLVNLTKLTFSAFRPTMEVTALPGPSPLSFTYKVDTSSGNRPVKVAPRNLTCLRSRCVAILSTSLNPVKNWVTCRLPLLTPTYLTFRWMTPTAEKETPLCLTEAPGLKWPLNIWAWYFTAVILRRQCPGLLVP